MNNFCSTRRTYKNETLKNLFHMMEIIVYIKKKKKRMKV